MYLLTGHTGFLGRVILSSLDHCVTISRSGGDIRCDLANEIPHINKLTLHSVIHNACLAHFVPKSDAEKKYMYDQNIAMTTNLLSGLQTMVKAPEQFIYISSVSVYGLDSGKAIKEDSQLAGQTPYAKSKIESEKRISTWCRTNNVKCIILRLPLIVGSGAPGNFGSMVNAISKGYYFNIGGGRHRRSMVLASDVANMVATIDKVEGVFNLTDGVHPSIRDVSFKIAELLRKRKPLNLPMWIGAALARCGDLLGEASPINSVKLDKITSDLTFDDSKARMTFNWKPSPVLSKLSFQS